MTVEQRVDSPADDALNPVLDVGVAAAEVNGSDGGANDDRLAQRAARGAGVTLVGQGVRIVLQTATVAVLARLLDPHDYGLLAMVLVIVGIGEIFRDFGLSNAAIQAKTLKSVEQRDALFWVNSVIGLVLTAIVFAGAPLAAWAFGQPNLLHITQVLAFTFIINGLATQYRADRLSA